MKRISVITINYNNLTGLKATIESVIGQTYTELEYIVIDGGSADGSAELIKNTGGIAYFVSEKDKGIYHAQNKGIKASTGDYCLFLNSGDCLTESNTIEKAVQAGLDKDIVYGDLILEDREGNRSRGISPDNLNSFHFMISTLWHPCSFIKRSLFEKYGNYRENYRITGDYEFFIRTILKHKASYKHIRQFISIFNTEGIGSSDKHRELQEKEREQSWLDNFSEFAYTWIKTKTKLKRRFSS